MKRNIKNNCEKKLTVVCDYLNLSVEKFRQSERDTKLRLFLCISHQNPR